MFANLAEFLLRRLVEEIEAQFARSREPDLPHEHKDIKQLGLLMEFQESLTAALGAYRALIREWYRPPNGDRPGKTS